jgi:hypothetical protein
MRKSWQEGSHKDEQGSPSVALTSLERSRINNEAEHAAATRGGPVLVGGWDLQTRTIVDESGYSPMMEGLLCQIAEYMTRRAQVRCYLQQGLTKQEIIRAVWKGEGGSYKAACAQYEEIVASLKQKNYVAESVA